jgi:hypothetical protein
MGQPQAIDNAYRIGGTMWPAFFNVLSVAACTLSLAALWFAVRNVTVVRELQARLTRFPLSRLDSLETSLADQAEAMTVLANRVKMHRVRTAANHIPDDKPTLPDPYRDPDAWRKAMNARLQKGKL